MPIETNKHAGGRPTKYSEAMDNAICDGIKHGKGLRPICAELDIDVGSIFNWLREQPEFFKRYAQAREIQAEVLADEIVALADDCRLGEKVTVKGDGKVETVTGDMVERSKLQVDARKWVAARLLPKKFGDRVTSEHIGENGGPIRFEIATLGSDVTNK